MFDMNDYSNMHTSVSFATAMMTASDLPQAAEVVNKVAKASRDEYKLTHSDCKSVKNYVTMALQSQSVVRDRTFDAGSISALAKLVTKLEETEPRDL